MRGFYNFRLRVVLAIALTTTSVICSLFATKDDCDKKYVDSYASCVSLKNPDGTYRHSVEFCAQVALDIWRRCVNALPANSGSIKPPPLPPNERGVGTPPNTVGVNTGPNIGGPGPESIFGHFTPTDPCNWTGFYIGFNSGATFNHLDLSKQMTDVNLTQQFYDITNEIGAVEENFLTTFHVPGHSETDGAMIGGGQTGFELQFGHFVFGAEGGFSGNGSEAHGSSSEFQTNELFLFTEQQNTTAETEFTSKSRVTTNWNGYFGGKLGFCWNGFLFYGTGGVAFTDVHLESSQTANSSFFQPCQGDCTQAGQGGITKAVQGGAIGRSQDQLGGFVGQIVSNRTTTQGDVLTGWYGGFGTDYQLTNVVSVGVEYRHVDWGGVDEHLTGGMGPVFTGNGHLDLNADQVVFKVNFLIGPLLGH
jgi:opacity protein-like surface antigen